MRYQDLHSDIHHDVFQHISPADALRLSTSCRLIHRHAMPRILSQVSLCRGSRQVRSFYEAIERDLEHRACWIRKFSFNYTSFMEDPGAALAFGADRFDTLAVNMVLDVLEHAPMLRELDMGFLEPVFEHFPRMVGSLTRLENLRRISIHDGSLAWFSVLLQTQSRPQVLEYFCSHSLAEFNSSQIGIKVSAVDSVQTVVFHAPAIGLGYLGTLIWPNVTLLVVEGKMEMGQIDLLARIFPNVGCVELQSKL